MLAWCRYEPTVHFWYASAEVTSCVGVRVWPLIKLHDVWMKHDSEVMFGKSNLSERVVPPTCWKRGSACMCLWEDERRQMGEKKKNAAVASVLIASQEMWRVCLRVRRCSQTPKLQCSCETAAQRPPAVSLQRVLISGTKPSYDFLPSCSIWARVGWIAWVYLTVELAA